MTTVTTSDERYTTLFVETLHDDYRYWGFGANPERTGINGASSGKSGKTYFFVTNLNASGAGSFAQARSDASSAGGGWIIFQVSGSWPSFTLPANTVIDARGQNVEFTGEVKCEAARPVVANVYVSDSADRGFDVAGTGWLAAFFTNIRGNGQIVDQMWNFGLSSSTNNGGSFTVQNCRFDYGGTNAEFNAFGNVGSEGSGSEVNARGGEDMYGTWGHIYTEREVEIRTPNHNGSYGHVFCGYIGYWQEGITAKNNVLGHIGEVWVDHPTADNSSTTASFQNQFFHHPEAAARLNCPNYLTEVRKLGNTGTLTLSNANEVRDPATFYTYTRHANSQGAAHDTFIQNRAGNVEQVTISGTAHPTVAAGAVSGKTFVFTLASNRIWNSTWGTTQQNAFIAAISGIDATTIFTASNIVRTSPTVITATASSDAVIAEDATIYFEGGDGIVVTSGDDLSNLKSWNHVTITATTDETVTPTTKALTLTTFAPSLVEHIRPTPTTAALTLTTFAPTVDITSPVTVTPTTVALTTETFAPTVTKTEHQTVTPSAASLTLTSFAPTVTRTGDETPTPSTASLTLTTFAPTVTASDHIRVTPTTASLSLTPGAPVVTTTSDNEAVRIISVGGGNPFTRRWRGRGLGRRS